MWTSSSGSRGPGADATARFVDRGCLSSFKLTFGGAPHQLVLADANYVLSVCDLPAYDRDEDEDDADELMGSGRVKDEEQDGDGCLLVRSQHSLAHAPKAGTTWTGLEAGARCAPCFNLLHG